MSREVVATPKSPARAKPAACLPQQRQAGKLVAGSRRQTGYQSPVMATDDSVQRWLQPEAKRQPECPLLLVFERERRRVPARL
jgi:hypothetical protein